MLSKFDDYPIHQTSMPIAQPATGDRNAYDRYWFNGYQDDGEFYFGIGAALYPNLGVLDCGLSIVRDGEQHAFHASRRAPVRTHATCRSGRSASTSSSRCAECASSSTTTTPGSSADLTFSARTACVEEGRQIRHGGAATHDGRHAVRAVRALGRRDPLRRKVRARSTHARVYGTKDRSWGVRPVGPPDPGVAPSIGRIPPDLLPLGTAALGRPVHALRRVRGRIRQPLAHRRRGAPGLRRRRPTSRAPRIRRPSCSPTSTIDLDYLPGTRRAGHATIASGRTPTVCARRSSSSRCICFRMKGIGYMHPEWGHGLWKGELAVGGESWKVDELDPMAFENQHLQQVVRGDERRRAGRGCARADLLRPAREVRVQRVARPGEVGLETHADDKVRLEYDGSIAVITNDNPDKRNAFDDAMDRASGRSSASCARDPTCGR